MLLYKLEDENEASDTMSVISATPSGQVVTKNANKENKHIGVLVKAKGENGKVKLRLSDTMPSPKPVEVCVRLYIIKVGYYTTVKYFLMGCYILVTLGWSLGKLLGGNLFSNGVTTSLQGMVVGRISKWNEPIFFGGGGHGSQSLKSGGRGSQKLKSGREREGQEILPVRSVFPPDDFKLNNPHTSMILILSNVHG